MFRFFCALLFSSMLLSTPTHAMQIRISDDRGGRIGTYMGKYEMLRDSGEQIVIDGKCLSACTLVTAFIPKGRVCVTSRAVLGFHAAWDYGNDGRPVTSPGATELLMSSYPRPIQAWIKKRGGLTPKMIRLSGRALERLYPRCQ
ncbi:MAG: hypothetical protein P4L81_08290 [Candidatus Pacebacteria bacterium]|nr:hypothetical protein [Candidatus Paceibacterota bacterium]